MKFQDYVKGKELFENYIAYDENDSYNDFLKENQIDEFLSDMQFNFLNEADDKGSNIFKKLINRRKIKNNAKKYVQAYLAYEMCDIELAKLKKTDKWSELDSDTREQKYKAFDKKKEAARNRVSAIAERIDVLGKNANITDFANSIKTKAKIAAAEKVMQIAKAVYSESAYAELETSYEDLKIASKKADEVILAAQEEEKNNADEIIKNAENNGFKKVSKDKIDNADNKTDETLTLKNKNGEDVYLIKSKQTKTDDSNTGKSEETPEEKAINKYKSDIEGFTQITDKNEKPNTEDFTVITVTNPETKKSERWKKEKSSDDKETEKQEAIKKFKEKIEKLKSDGYKEIGENEYNSNKTEYNDANKYNKQIVTNPEDNKKVFLVKAE